MKCLGKNGQCGSTTHPKRDCPHEPGNQNRTDTHFQYTDNPEESPLFYVHDEAMFMFNATEG
eukprot:3000444-Karenia_brevis.AAC.1